MMYVRLRSADSICATEDAFFRTNPEYRESHSFGMGRLACKWLGTDLSIDRTEGELASTLSGSWDCIAGGWGC